jgi:hypothetical protein
LKFVLPRDLVALEVKLAMMDPANRDSEFIAHSFCKCTWLHVGEMMGIAWCSAAYQASLP